MFVFKDLRYRLRKDATILGYMRKVYGGAYFYSKDSNWWTGREINYKQIDEWTGFKDKNRKLIYEWDIVYYKIDPQQKPQLGAILWQKKNKRFGIRDLRQDLFLPLKAEGLKLFKQDELEIYSYLFINPEILEKWDLKD